MEKGKCFRAGCTARPSASIHRHSGRFDFSKTGRSQVRSQGSLAPPVEQDLILLPPSEILCQFELGALAFELLAIAAAGKDVAGFDWDFFDRVRVGIRGAEVENRGLIFGVEEGEPFAGWDRGVDGGGEGAEVVGVVDEGDGGSGVEHRGCAEKRGGRTGEAGGTRELFPSDEDDRQMTITADDAMIGQTMKVAMPPNRSPTTRT